MSEDVQSIAAAFVDLVVNEKLLDNGRQLDPQELDILLTTIRAAGFEAKEVVSGIIAYEACQMSERGPIHTGRFHPVNARFPYKIINFTGADHAFATGWMSCAVKRVSYGPTGRNETREQLVELMMSELSRSQPLDPIRLDNHGNLLCEIPPRTHPVSISHFVPHTRDHHEAPHGKVGYHKYCGWIYRSDITTVDDVLTCDKCDLRVIIPAAVLTYNEIRLALAPAIMAAAA